MKSWKITEIWSLYGGEHSVNLNKKINILQKSLFSIENLIKKFSAILVKIKK